MCITTQQQVLDALGQDCLTLDELAAMIPDRTRQGVAMAMSRLARKDLVERVEAGCFRRSALGHEVLELGEVISHGGSDGPPERPRPPRDSLRQRAWSAMRMRRKFSIGELEVVAALGAEKQGRDTIRRMCAELTRAGVLRKLPGRSFDGGARFAMLRDLGPLAPARRFEGRSRLPFLLDHNSGEELPL